MTHQERALKIVRDFVQGHLDVTDGPQAFSAYVVWFNYTLGYWKALVSTSLPDGMYYEVTYDRAKEQTYLDAYKKFQNVCIPDE